MKVSTTGYNGISLKQQFLIIDKSTWESRGVLIGLNNKRIRLRFPTMTSGIHYLDGASNDLLIMTALAIAQLVPLGVFADKLQDEFPQREEEANLLREWQVLRDKEII